MTDEGRCSADDCWYTLPLVDGLIVAHSKAGKLNVCEGGGRPPREPLTALEWLRVTHADTLSGRRIEEAVAEAARPGQELRERVEALAVSWETAMPGDISRAYAAARLRAALEELR